MTTRRQVAGLAVFMLVMGAVMIAMTWSANTGFGRVLIVALFPVVTVGGLAWIARKYSRWTGPTSATQLAASTASPKRTLTRVVLYGLGVAFLFSPLRDYWTSALALVSGFISGILAGTAKFGSSHLG